MILNALFDVMDKQAQGKVRLAREQRQRTSDSLVTHITVKKGFEWSSGQVINDVFLMQRGESSWRFDRRPLSC